MAFVQNIPPVDSCSSTSLEVEEMSVQSLSVPSLSTSSFSSNNNVIGVLTVPNLQSTQINTQSFTADQLQADTVSAGTINAGNANIENLTSDNYNSSNVSCSSFNAVNLNCDTVNSQYYETSNFTTKNMEIVRNGTENPQKTRVTSTIKNGTLETVANYKMTNNAPSLFSDLQLASSPTGPNTLFIYGDVINSTTSLPRIIGYNSTLEGFDNGTGFGGQIAYLSLSSNNDAPSPNTLRYERNGKLSIYSGPSTVVWQSTNLVSDVRDKEDLRPLLNCHEDLLTCKGYYFNYIGEPDRQRAGLIAQEVAEIFPEVIIKPESKEPTLSIDYTNMVPVLIGSLKEIAAEINELSSYQ